ncbi:MAG TPA: hypothetical protein V6D08_08800 [Candidatus Obscuribacterales bacterium]
MIKTTILSLIGLIIGSATGFAVALAARPYVAGADKLLIAIGAFAGLVVAIWPSLLGAAWRAVERGRRGAILAALLIPIGLVGVLIQLPELSEQVKMLS